MTVNIIWSYKTFHSPIHVGSDQSIVLFRHEGVTDRMLCVLRGRLPGVCGSVSCPPLQHQGPSSGLPSPSPKHVPSTYSTNMHHGIKRMFSTVVNSSSSASVFSTLRERKERRAVRSVAGCGWGLRSVRGISLTAPRHLFWEKDPKGGYGREVRRK